MGQINELITKEAVKQLKEVHADLKALSNLSDEGIRLKCLEIASKDNTQYGTLNALAVAKDYYEFVKGI